MAVGITSPMGHFLDRMIIRVCIFQGIKIFQLFDGKLQKLQKTSDDSVESIQIKNEIESWIDLLLKTLFLDRNIDRSSDLICKILEESERSPYTKQTATDKVYILRIQLPCLIQA